MVLLTFQGGFATTLILFPLYWQVVRGESATTAGLLMGPAGFAVAVALQFSGRLIDRLPPIRVIGPGITITVLASAALAVQLTVDVPAWQLVVTSMILNVGAGFTLMPTMTVATRSLEGPAIPAGSTILAVISQISVSIGIAPFSVVLATTLSARVSQGQGGGVGSLSALPPAELALLAPQLADAFRAAFWLPVVTEADTAVDRLEHG